MSSKMVSLHLPASRSTGVGRAAAAPPRGELLLVLLTRDRLEGQQLDVLPSGVGRAVVLGQSAAVLLVRPLHVLRRLGL